MLLGWLGVPTAIACLGSLASLRLALGHLLPCRRCSVQSLVGRRRRRLGRLLTLGGELVAATRHSPVLGHLLDAPRHGRSLSRLVRKARLHHDKHTRVHLLRTKPLLCEVVLVEHKLRRLHVRVLLPRDLPCKHLVQNDAKGPDVRGGRVQLRVQLLGGHPPNGSDRRLGLILGALDGTFVLARHAKVGDHRRAQLVHQDVPSCQIAMNDALVVQVRDARANADAECLDLCVGEGSRVVAVEHVVKRALRAERSHNRERLEANTVQRDNVGMRSQVYGSLRLQHEHLDDGRLRTTHLLNRHLHVTPLTSVHVAVATLANLRLLHQVLRLDDVLGVNEVLLVAGRHGSTKRHGARASGPTAHAVHRVRRRPHRAQLLRTSRATSAT
mmetsp:Transcript_3121/g.10234  ORF Transcript_3121/g.10234 Transcript_3121/m.10234 type:complete len:385 (+) Transcript_3121:164-1318(+)